MRILALLALAGALGLALPCAAQTASDPTRAMSVAKQAAVTQPQLLAPPEPTPTGVSTVPTLQPARIAPPRPMPAAASPEQIQAEPNAAFSRPERLLDWMQGYRKHPSPSRLPAAVRAMRELGLFADDEKEAFCTGFIAGVLADNTKAGPALLAKMLPMPDKDQAVLIRAIAYSGRPDWRDILTKFKPRMALREPLIDSYLSGAAKPMMQAELDNSPLIYSLWGYYVATGHYEPVVRIIQALRWSKNKDDGSFSWSKMVAGWKHDPSAVDKITTGGTAKWTLASYAERDRDLLQLYRAEYDREPEEIARPLKDVIESAEVFESEKVRKDQFGAIEDAQKLQATNEAGMSKAATAGSIAIATGCVAASALGQVYIAVPCVIGGALYTGAVKLMH